MTSERPAETIGRAISSGTRRLRAAGIANPRLDAELLLGHLLWMTRTRLAIDATNSVAPDMLLAFDELLTQRIAGQPVAYLTGHREFMGHDFLVGPGVLVPRPETEILVERAVAMIERHWPVGQVRVLDLCTGSGAIALSLAIEMSKRAGTEALHYDRGRAHFTGSDISPEALGYALQNRTGLGLDDRVEFVQGDLLSWTAGPWDLILSNPPYLRPDQIDGNNEIAAEPRLALDGGRDGLEFIEQILDQVVTVSAPKFGMIIELDPDHAHRVREMAAERFPGASVIIVPDLAGRDRFVSIEREVSAT